MFCGATGGSFCNVWMKKAALPLLFSFVFGCTGSISNETSISSAVESMAEQNSVTLLSNSTQSQNKCETGNKVVIQVALSAITKYYCRDKSSLMDSVKLGPVCSGGVTIEAISVDSGTKDCSQLTLCGKNFDSKVDITKRIDGTSVQQLTFTDLPWGCEGRIEASSSPDFTSADTQKVNLQVLAPSCPFCAATNGVTCEACSAADQNNMMFVGGQLIPSTCTGGCSTCPFPPPDSPTFSVPGVVSATVAHGDLRSFYSTANAVCGQTCTQAQQIRVCNNGSWVPGEDSAFPTQCREPAPSSCVTTSNANTGFISKIASMFSTKMGEATIMGPDGTVTCSECQSGSCTACTTDSGSAGFRLYSAQTVPNGSLCSSISQCQTCVGGLFQGDPSYKYGACTVLSAPCTLAISASPYPSGTTKTLYNGGNCDPISLQCVNGSWRNTVTLEMVSQTTANTYTETCTPAVNCTTAGGISILNGNSRTVFAMNQSDYPNSCYAATNYRNLSCVNGQISPSDPGATFRYTECTLKQCNDPRNMTNKINAGTTVTAWSVSAPNCLSLPTPQEYCNNNRITITCPNTGGTATYTTSGTTDLTAYTQTSCTVPTSCSGCVVSKIDVGSVTVGLNSTMTFFKSNTNDFCQSIGKTFTCQPGVSGTSATLIDPVSSESHTVYPYMNCSQTGGSDQGSLGGTGGGTGNDNGPGSALRKRFGAGEGAGGGGSCVDATNCHSNYSYAVQSTTVMFSPCMLPWPNRAGEIEFYGSVMAFSAAGLSMASGTNDTVCVTLPDRCSNHRQSRTCHFPKLTGAPEYQFPNCVEKVSCP